MKTMKTKLSLRHETFLTERENSASVYSTNQAPPLDAFYKGNVPSGRLVGRENEYWYVRSVGTVGEGGNLIFVG